MQTSVITLVQAFILSAQMPEEKPLPLVMPAKREHGKWSRILVFKALTNGSIDQSITKPLLTLF